VTTVIDEDDVVLCGEAWEDLWILDNRFSGQLAYNGGDQDDHTDLGARGPHV
jgi:hypothetical protein